MFAHHEVRTGVGTAVTDRHGGVSDGAWARLNLADHVGDDPSAVAENRRLVATSLGDGGVALVTMRQVHGADVAVVDAMPADPPTADALVTRSSGLALTVLVADCTPVLLTDSRARVVAAVHVGRRGLTAGVVAAAVTAMRELGAGDDGIEALIGPSICRDHYEVPETMRTQVDTVVPGAAATTADGRPALDIRAGLRRQLYDVGVRQPAVLMRCTAESSDLYSYRRDGVTGRFAGVVWLEP